MPSQGARQGLHDGIAKKGNKRSQGLGLVCAGKRESGTGYGLLFAFHREAIHDDKDAPTVGTDM